MSTSRERSLKEEIEKAFADSIYPGDDNILGALYDYENVCQTFKDKHWKDLTRETINRHYGSVFLLTPPAFRFYLPAYLIAALDQAPGDQVLPTIVSILTPPLDTSEPTAKSNFLERVEGLTSAQRHVIKLFLEYVTEERVWLDDSRAQALKHFWDSTLSKKQRRKTTQEHDSTA